MRGELFFEIPDDQEVMVKLIEAVPSNWSWVDGNLHAPETLIASGQAEEHTGFAVERFHSIHPTIVGSYDQDERKQRKSNLFAIMAEQKMPGFILFGEAGYDADVVTLELAKRIAVSFLRKGYRGSLRFYMDCYRNRKFDNPARCDIIFKPWHGAPALPKESGPQPARVKLGWESRYNGTEKNIAPIVAVCRSLNLHEYLPEIPDELIAHERTAMAEAS